MTTKPEPSSSVASQAHDKEGIFAEMEIGCRLHFLDSGSFTMWTKAAEYGKLKGCSPYRFYDTPDFFEYMDAYAAFIKKHKHAIDYYANVDAIPDPEVSWKNLRYLEKKHGLSPVPVIHYKTDMSWVKRYIDRGHKLIALGGLVGSTAQEACRAWLDKAFDVICSGPGRLPRVRTHGFGVTSHPLLFRYPWWSVDSTSWTMIGANGAILVPHRRDSKWVFTTPPYTMKFSNKSKEINLKGKHFFTMSKQEKGIVLAWLEEIAIPLGRNGANNEILTYGVINRHCERKAANLLYYERLRASIPSYPWAFAGPKRTTLGIKL